MLSRGEWPNALDFSLDLELNIPRMNYLMNNSYGMLCSLLNERQLHMRTLDNARQFCAWPNFTRQETELSTSLNKVTKRSRHFTQRACRVLYSEKSRAFGQGFRLDANVIFLSLHRS